MPAWLGSGDGSQWLGEGPLVAVSSDGGGG